MDSDNIGELFGHGTSDEFMDGRKRYRKKVAEIAAKIPGRMDKTGYSAELCIDLIIEKCTLMATVDSEIFVVLRFTDHPGAFHNSKGKRGSYVPGWSGDDHGGLAQSFVKLTAWRAMRADVLAWLDTPESES